MAVSPPYHVAAINNLMYPWLDSVVGSGKARKAYQNAAEPTFPYATVWQKTLKRKSQHPSVVMSENALDPTLFDVTSAMPVTLEFDINIYTNTNDVELDAHILMERALRKLEVQATLEAWSSAGVQVLHIGNPLSLPYRENEKWIQRVMAELHVSVWSIVRTTVETIENAEMSSSDPTIAPFLADDS